MISSRTEKPAGKYGRRYMEEMSLISKLMTKLHRRQRILELVHSTLKKIKKRVTDKLLNYFHDLYFRRL